MDMIFDTHEILSERQKRGLTQDRLAAISGVPSSKISKIEHGSEAHSATLRRLTKALQGTICAISQVEPPVQEAR